MADNLTDSCTVDFRLFGENRGIYYDETNRCLMYLTNHETLSDLYSTIQHELIHFCLAKLGITDDIDEEQEEKIIFMMAWATQDCLF